jgi:hypothetical protein
MSIEKDEVSLHSKIQTFVRFIDSFRPKKKFDVSGYIGQKIRVGRQIFFFSNFFYCTDSGQNKHVRSLMHTTAVNQCNFF